MDHIIHDELHMPPSPTVYYLEWCTKATLAVLLVPPAEPCLEALSFLLVGLLSAMGRRDNSIQTMSNRSCYCWTSPAHRLNKFQMPF